MNHGLVSEQVDDAELGQVSRIVSWLLLVGFLLLSGAARGVYSAQEIQPSARFEALAVVGFVTFVWYWIKQECAPYNVSFPIDLAWFMALLWFVLAPYYLWRVQRWRGLVKFGVLIGTHAASYVVTVAVHYFLVWLG